MPDVLTKRWTKSVADERAVANGCRFDEGRALHVVDFFQELNHTKGQWAGQPFELLDWQRDDLIMPLFGWVNGDGWRRFRVAYVEVGKKNGKSTLCGGIALYLLAGDGEVGAQVYCAAADRTQAGIVYREASEMAKASPLLRDYVIPRDSVKNLALPSTGSFLRVISRDAFTAEGLDIHGLIFDELHAQKTRDLWDSLRYGGAARRQPMLVSITTAGFDRESICFEQKQRAQQLLDNVIHDDTFFAYIRAADKDDDWTDPKVWRKANPSLGAIIKESELAADCEEAKESPAKENTFKRYRLNIWTQQSVRWIQLAKWDRCLRDFDPETLKGKQCWGGLDLGATSDLTSLCLLFPDEDEESDAVQALWWFWVPLEVARKRERVDHVPYESWASLGWIKLTDGDEIDYGLIRKDINKIADSYPIGDLAADRLFQGAQLCQELAGDGFNVVPFGQGFYSMASPSVEFERLVNAGKFGHRANPVMRWQIDGVAVKMDPAGNIKPDKSKVGPIVKIDGVVAAIMALGRYMERERKAESVYETRGILYL